MNSGKTTALLQVAYNYEERGQHVALAKPATDTKGARHMVSRLGVEREVDFLIHPADDVLDVFRRFAAGKEGGTLIEKPRPLDALLIDEAQFLTARQVDDLMRIALLDNVPVLTYGIRTDFQTVAFPGARRLLEIAHTLEELKTICVCGRKAIFNARKVGGHFIFDGDQVAIDGTDATYESLCGNCYLQESSGQLSPTSS